MDFFSLKGCHPQHDMLQGLKRIQYIEAVTLISQVFSAMEDCQGALTSGGKTTVEQNYSRRV